MLNGVGDSLKNVRDLLNSLVLRIVVRCVEMPRRIGIGQRLFARAGDNMLFKSKVAIKIVCFFGIAKELVPARPAIW